MSTRTRAERHASFADPDGWLQKETGLTSRQIIATAKRNGWPVRRIYGTLHVCGDFAELYAEMKHTEEATR